MLSLFSDYDTVRCSFFSSRKEKDYRDTALSALKVGSRMSVKPEEINQQYTECPSCKNEYNDFIRTPRILPCLHALCISCLETGATRGVVKCPTCEINHSVPNGDLETFRNDETRLFLVNHQRVKL